ncbi:MAG: hypothetical protein JHC95_12565 [Solirubrobacteraceae bacterium]|nr:hypothetical protein [Solirubrobacteraceae bacterium]
MTLSLVVGAPGAGKSYYAVRAISDAVQSGRLVATNVTLEEDWAPRVAGANIFRRLIPGRRRKLEAAYRDRVLVSDDLSELFSIRLRGQGEGRGLMVLDEAHNWMNSRAWRDQDRTEIVRFFSQHRKLGWDVLLITQDELNVDRQVRSLFEYLVTLRNLRNAKFLGVRVVPFHCFLAIWTWNATNKTVIRRELYRLHKPTARLYDTMGLSHGLADAPENAIWLPRTAN